MILLLCWTISITLPHMSLHILLVHSHCHSGIWMGKASVCNHWLHLSLTLVLLCECIHTCTFFFLPVPFQHSPPLIPLLPLGGLWQCVTDRNKPQLPFLGQHFIVLLMSCPGLSRPPRVHTWQKDSRGLFAFSAEDDALEACATETDGSDFC